MPGDHGRSERGRRRYGTPSRRSLLAGAAALPLPTVLPTGSALAGSRTRSAYDHTARETFDEFDRIFHDSGGIGRPDRPNENGGLAWGQSYVQMGFLRMYAAYGDTHYLDRLVHNADLVLAQRDSERGVADWTGSSLPAWRAMLDYTAATYALVDADGTPVMEVRSARSGSAGSKLEVVPESDEYFTIVIVPPDGEETRHTHLTMDGGSEDYAVDRIYRAYDETNRTTAAELTSTKTPVAQTGELTARPVLFTAHTGMIAYPLAGFARVVRRHPRLRANAHYRAKADTYLEAAEAALRVHEEEFVATESGGHYIYKRGTPVGFDGTASPLNYTTAMGRAWLELAHATGDPEHLDRGTRIARTVAGQFEKDGGGAYLWSYWPTFSPVWKGYAATGDPATDISLYTPSFRPGSGVKSIDDCSHGAITADFACLAAQDGVVFGPGDVDGLARTYTQNLATRDADGVATVHVRLDGTGVAGSGQYFQAPRWIRTAWSDRAVFDHALEIYNARQPKPEFGSALCGTASLNWYARKGGLR